MNSFLSLLEKLEEPKIIKEAINEKTKRMLDEGKLQELIDEIILEHKEVVEEYKGGKESALQFLIGQGMKKSKGSANPELLKTILLKSI